MNLQLEIFKKQRALLAQGWTQWRAARNSIDFPVEVTDQTACKWCFVGALWLAEKQYGVSDDFHHEPETEMDRFMGNVLWDLYGRGDYISWNDDPRTTQAMVLAYCDELIKRKELAA